MGYLVTNKNNIMQKISVIGLGNDILGDDAIGLIAVRELKEVFGSAIDVYESPNGGLELLDYLEGYDKALILDSLFTGEYPVGSIVEYSSSDFEISSASTPHYIGLPEVVKLAEKLNISIPKDIRILLIEVENPYEVTTIITKIVKAKAKHLINRAAEIVKILAI